MNVDGKHYRTIWEKEGDTKAVQIIDQRGLPHKFIIEDLKTVNEFIGTCYQSKEDHVSHEIDFFIDEKKFKQILEILQTIKDAINFPLNNANLIFKASEEVDLDGIMQGLIDGG